MIRFWMLAVACSLPVGPAVFGADPPTAVWTKAEHGDKPRGSAVTNGDPAFTLALTSKYVRVKSVGDALYTFRTTDASCGAFISIYRLGHTVEPGSIDVSNFKDRDVRRIGAAWKSLQLDAFAWRTKSKDGRTSVALWTQLPLERQAVAILMLVPEKQEESADGLFQDFLNGIDGPTNWRIAPQLTVAQRAAQVAIGVGLLLIVLAVPVCLLVVLRRAQQAGNPATAAKLQSLVTALSPSEPQKARYWLRVFALTFGVIALVLGYLSLLTLGVALIGGQRFGEAFRAVTLLLNVVLLIPLIATPFLLMKTLRCRGAIVADLGPDRLRMLFWTAGILCLIAATLQGFSGLHNLNRQPLNVGQWYAVSLAALMLSMVPQFAIRAFGRIQLTENGIFQNCFLLRWDQVDFYRWTDGSTHLSMKSKGPLSLNLPVPAINKQPIQELLARHGVAQRSE